MTLLVHLEGSGPKYQRIYRSLRKDILDGRLRPGTRLPATRSLAEDLQVSRTTVVLAYRQLLVEGYISGKVGSGSYVSPTLPETLLSTSPRDTDPDGGDDGGKESPAKTTPVRLSRHGQRVLRTAPLPVPGHLAAPISHDFHPGQPAIEEFPYEIWRRLIQRRTRAQTVSSLRYGEPGGYRPLREAVAEYLTRARALNCRPDQVVIVTGSQQALDLVGRVLIDPGDRVALEDPHYQGARHIFAAHGADLVPVPVDGDGLRVDKLPRDASTGNLKLVYVTPSHQFPTGAVLPLARRLSLLAWAEETSTYIVEDDYDNEYRYEDRPVESLQGLDRNGNVLYVGTFSKTLYPSLRIGYLVLPDALREPILAAKWLTDRHTPSLEQEALTDFIQEGHLERHLRRSRLRNASRRKVLLESLDVHLGGRIDVIGSRSGMHVLVSLPEVRPSRLPELVRAAEQQGVKVYSLTPYCLRPPQRAGIILGYASLSEEQIREGVRRLAAVILDGAWSREPA